MNEREHQQALIQIKDDAQDVIRTEQFRSLVQDFLNRYNNWRKALVVCKRMARHHPVLVIPKDAEPGEPPQPGWEVESRNDYLLELVDESKPKPKEWFKNGDRIIHRRFWRPQLPPNPVELLMPLELFDRLHQKDDNLTPDRPRDAMKDYNERLAAYAFLVAVVCCKLSDGIIGIELPEEPADDVWGYYSELDNTQEYHRGDKTRSKLRDALFDVKHVCIQEQQAKQIVEIVKTDSIPPHQAAVLDIANKVDWLVMKAGIRARFIEHIDRFYKMVEDYGQALQPYTDKLKKAEKRWKQEGTKLSLAEYCPPPKGWVETNSWDNPFINVDSRVIFSPAEPVNPLLWFGIFGSSGIQRTPNESEKLMCEYVRLAIIHDYELRYSGTPTDSYIFSAEYKGRWFQRDKFCKDVWEYYHYDNQPADLLHYSAVPQEKLSQLNRAFARVQTDIANTPNQTQQPELPDGEIFDGLTWDKSLTQEKIKYIEDTFGPLAKNLIELAGLVRESRGKYMKAGQAKKGDARWIEVDENARLTVSVDKWGTLIRTFASAKLLLRPEITPAVGSEQQARRFYEAIYTAITGQDFSFGKMMLGAVLSSESRGENQVKEVSNFQVDLFRETLNKAKECNVESITKTLEVWHNNALLIHASGQIANEKPKLQPLTKKARLIYEKLCALQPHEAMTLPDIQTWLYDEHKINLDEGTWKDIRKELIPYGLKNRPRVGYYIEKK
ncbi:MAG: hypothetical protein ABSH16_00370 [Sedimentisphaerales bacterium]